MKKYDVIYADPPWRYRHCRTNNRKIENHYNTMTTEDICDFNIPAKKNCVLYMWATAPKIKEALKVMEAWGFNYKTQAIWDKQIIGMGYWFRGQHEILLVGVKGKFSPPKPHLRISSMLSFRRTKHSKKPFEVREMIKKMFPKKKRLEMFAREKTKGWDSIGDEINVYNL